jgi:hypothetical protein
MVLLAERDEITSLRHFGAHVCDVGRCETCGFHGNYIEPELTWLGSNVQCRAELEHSPKSLLLKYRVSSALAGSSIEVEQRGSADVLTLIVPGGEHLNV